MPVNSESASVRKIRFAWQVLSPDGAAKTFIYHIDRDCAKDVGHWNQLSLDDDNQESSTTRLSQMKWWE
jgi:hypothetical protein